MSQEALNRKTYIIHTYICVHAHRDAGDTYTHTLKKASKQANTHTHTHTPHTCTHAHRDAGAHIHSRKKESKQANTHTHPHTNKPKKSTHLKKSTRFNTTPAAYLVNFMFTRQCLQTQNSATQQFPHNVDGAFGPEPSTTF